MVLSWRAMKRKLLYALAFVAFSYLFYNIGSLMNAGSPPVPHGDMPFEAVPAYAQADGRAESRIGGSGGLAERLRIFYWYGE